MMNIWKNWLWVILMLSSCAQLEKSKYNKKFEKFVDDDFETYLADYPETLTFLGRKDRYHELNDNSEAFSITQNEKYQNRLKRLLSFNREKLSESNQLNYDLYKLGLEESLEYFQWRHHNYPVNQMFGGHTAIINFMTNFHKVESKEDAQAYIERVAAVEEKIKNLRTGLKIRKDKKIVAPYFVYDKVIRDCKNIIKMDKEKDILTPLHIDFYEKVSSLELSEDITENLKKSFDVVFSEKFIPAYQELIADLKELKKVAPLEGSAAVLPDGVNFYKYALKDNTSTDLSAEYIHHLGLTETARIHSEMKKIMNDLNFEGSLLDFFKVIQGSEFTYPDTAEGKQSYLDDTNVFIKNMKEKLPKMFGRLPKADVVVKPVEPYREKSAGLAFYYPPSVDGKRPGIYYVNLHDMSAVNKTEMEALAYHEAVPGHHMQIAIALELDNMPLFRRMNSYTAFSEGWGLYAEYLPKEYGFYQDPYSDFGRLSMELWRAARLVVDTGLHHKKWTKKEAIAWLNKNTPSPVTENTRAIERYIVMPGQATAYKVGMLKIQELRDFAKKSLGDRYDDRDFHDQVLGNGGIPLDVLDKIIRDWVKSQVNL